MPTPIETEDRLREMLQAVASSVHDSDTVLDASPAGVAAPLTISPRTSRSTRRSHLLVFAASFLAVLMLGSITILMSSSEPPSGADSASPGVSDPGNEANADAPVSGLGMDGAHFVIEDHSWTLIQAWETPDDERGRHSIYEGTDSQVLVLTGSATDYLDAIPGGPGTTLTMNSNEVTERGSAPDLYFSWTTRDGTPVLVFFSGLGRDQAMQLATTLRPIDDRGWQQLLQTAQSELRARTGESGVGGEEGSGEWIRLDAPDAPEVILDLADGIELPPGQTFDRLLENLPQEPTEQTVEGVTSMLEFEAGCIWTGYWLNAVDSGDTEARDLALAVLDEIPTWPALNASDGGGVVDAWTRNAELAAAGDVQGVLDNLYTANCISVVPGQ